MTLKKVTSLISPVEQTWWTRMETTGKPGGSCRLGERAEENRLLRYDCATVGRRAPLAWCAKRQDPSPPHLRQTVAGHVPATESPLLTTNHHHHHLALHNRLPPSWPPLLPLRRTCQHNRRANPRRSLAMDARLSISPRHKSFSSSMNMGHTSESLRNICARVRGAPSVCQFERGARLACRLDSPEIGEQHCQW